jgi:hypothetical protein
MYGESMGSHDEEGRPFFNQRLQQILEVPVQRSVSTTSFPALRSRSGISARE